jgi:CRISPR-associated endonuclease/helicase Cas3
MNETAHSLIWAKTADSSLQQPLQPLRYHPLLLHLIDVAAVVTEMWASILTPAFRRLLVNGTGLPDGACCNWLRFAAATHDLGKCTPAFQQKNDSLARALEVAGILSGGQGRVGRFPPHGLLGTSLLRAAFSTRFNMPRGPAFQWASIAGGHHGIFPTREQVRSTTPETDPHSFGSGPWQLLRDRILDQLIDLLRPTAPEREPGCVVAVPAAGLVSVADWIASNQQFFPCAAQLGAEISFPPPPEYFARSCERARRALGQLGWLSIPEPSSPSVFGALFPGREPRQSQARIECLGKELKEASFILIEAPMGEGKTEAALLLADRLAAVAGQRGFYFGLPTQATSNQMFTRICSFLERRYGNTTAVPVILSHGHASLSPEFLNLLERGRLFSELSSVGDEPTEGVFASSWFVRSKRGLLAPFGVGTVDQALMASLITKHVFVRLFGLAGKVLVIDEVHAYDTYMSTLLERLLEWLGALQCSVVLLSATLPVARRNALLQAWVEGATGKPGTQIQIADQGYPRVSLARASGAIESFALPVSERSRRLLGVRWLGREALVECVLSALAVGGCAAVVCNTVSEAQETYSDLRRILDQQPEADRPELELLHSRFMLRDRQRIEQSVLERFGPGDSARPKKAILVATQIVEQSLDLDFDLMVSELAPVDLLLQRSGRLHRHPRQSRPRLLADPGLWIIDPGCDEDGLPVFGRRNSGIYQPYILLKSWVALRPRTTIRIPDDVEELIEGTYGQNAGAAESPLQSELSRLKSRMDADIANMEQEARNRFLPKPWAEVPLSNFTENPLEEDNPAVDRWSPRPQLTLVGRSSATRREQYAGTSAHGIWCRVTDNVARRSPDSDNRALRAELVIPRR